MPLPATSVGSLFTRMFNYLRTDDSLQLVPEGGGDPVPFIHGLRSGDVDATQQAARVPWEMVAITNVPLLMAGRYTYNGHSWTVVRDNHHKAATANTSYSYLLERHAN